jgi:hypothetical protein
MDKWHEDYWATQPEPKRGTRAHLEKYGGPGPIHIVAFVACLLCAAGLVWAIYYAFTLPIVYESYTTGNCVRVDDVRGVYSCENMPRKYHHAWTH